MPESPEQSSSPPEKFNPPLLPERCEAPLGQRWLSTEDVFSGRGPEASLGHRWQSADDVLSRRVPEGDISQHDRLQHNWNLSEDLEGSRHIPAHRRDTADSTLGEVMQELLRERSAEGISTGRSCSGSEVRRAGWNLNAADINLCDKFVLGWGAVGLVYKGHLRGKVVAVKVLRGCPLSGSGDGHSPGYLYLPGEPDHRSHSEE